MSTPIAITSNVAKLAGRIAHPRVVDRVLQSGLFLAGQNANGALLDLSERLQAEGVFVVFHDLADEPAQAIEASIWSSIAAEAANARMCIGSQVSLARALPLVAQANQAPTRKVALLLANAGELVKSLRGQALLRTMKAARDEVNMNTESSARLYIVGACERLSDGERLVGINSAFYRASLVRL